MPGGRPRKPDALKKLSGTDQPCRRSNVPDFGTVTKIPAAPKYMNKYAKKLYKTTASRLAVLGILNEVNLPLVVGYANEMGLYWEAQVKIQEEGEYQYFVDKNGNSKTVLSDVVKNANSHFANAKSYAVELGITPASAHKVKIPDQKPSNPFSDF
jgi:P27 family predicted phage terminase small subunit